MRLRPFSTWLERQYEPRCAAWSVSFDRCRRDDYIRPGRQRSRLARLGADRRHTRSCQGSPTGWWIWPEYFPEGQYPSSRHVQGHRSNAITQWVGSARKCRAKEADLSRWTAVVRGALMKGLASSDSAFAKVHVSGRKARKHYGMESHERYNEFKHFQIMHLR